MTFLQIQQRIADEIGEDQTVTATATIIKAWINQVYQHVSSLFTWPWLVSQTILQTEADITTGTATVNANSTSVTLSAGPAASVATNYMIQFTQASDDWYFISAHTAGATTLTISVAFNGTSNYTAGTYIIRKVYYVLASDVDRILLLRQARTDAKLEYIDPRTFLRLVPDPSQTGNPLYYFLIGMNSSNLWRIGFYPTPNAVINIPYIYLKRITELSGDTDEAVIPIKWHNVLVFGSLAFYGYLYVDDNRIRAAQEVYRRILDDMIANANHVPDQRIVLQPWDTRAGTYPVLPRFPSNFPQYLRYW